MPKKKNRTKEQNNVEKQEPEKTAVKKELDKIIELTEEQNRALKKIIEQK